ncbi:spike base protein, RCAP_Rcc01079 family [Paracoccus litorisediminis]|uniref:spike base protein, RCAP_Rcc01079 family n=1 Tax=Paracoccus litorisediminis TaxID=2006130 RepID=UPI003CCD3E43
MPHGDARDRVTGIRSECSRSSRSRASFCSSGDQHVYYAFTHSIRDAPTTGAFAVTPRDTVDLTEALRAVSINNGGTLSLTGLGLICSLGRRPTHIQAPRSFVVSRRELSWTAAPLADLLLDDPVTA